MAPGQRVSLGWKLEGSCIKGNEVFQHPPISVRKTENVCVALPGLAQISHHPTQRRFATGAGWAERCSQREPIAGFSQREPIAGFSPTVCMHETDQADGAQTAGAELSLPGLSVFTWQGLGAELCFLTFT